MHAMKAFLTSCILMLATHDVHAVVYDYRGPLCYNFAYKSQYLRSTFMPTLDQILNLTSQNKFTF